MSTHVPADEIEAIVGIKRQSRLHFGRAVSAEEVFYILHSAECRNSTPDLRDCPFSVALDSGIDPDEFRQDTAIPLGVDDDGYLFDAGATEAPEPLGKADLAAEIAAHDNKGFSEERCLRCGWVMGSPALNCNNDDTPHRFPSHSPISHSGEAPEPLGEESSDD